LVRAAEQLSFAVQRARKALLPSPSYDKTVAPTNKGSGAKGMAGAHVLQAVQHPELDTLGQVAIRDFLKKRVRFLRLVAQNKRTNGVNVTPITVVASIDPELPEDLIDMENIDADSIDVDDCTNESVINYLKKRKSEMRLLRPSSSRPKCLRRCRFQRRRRILRYASRRQLLTIILGTEI
jgi:hypothetical protein